MREIILIDVHKEAKLVETTGKTFKRGINGFSPPYEKKNLATLRVPPALTMAGLHPDKILLFLGYKKYLNCMENFW